VFVSSILKLRHSGQFVDAKEICYSTVQEIKSWRKQARAKQIQLMLAPEWVMSHKIYLDKTHQEAQRAQLLLRELDLGASLKLKDIFYDYVSLPSSLPEHLAYQFTLIKKADLAPYLKLLKQVRLKLTRLGVEGLPDLNLLPWREQAQQKQLYRRLAQLFLLPLSFAIGLYAMDEILVMRNEVLSQQTAFYYNKNLSVQVGQQPTLKRFAPAFTLIEKLPQAAEINMLGYANGNWFITGSLEDIQELNTLNDTLTKLSWLMPGGSVDLHEQDQHYLWQFKKLDKTP
jgi:hypothetical protein